MSIYSPIVKKITNGKAGIKNKMQNAKCKICALTRKCKMRNEKCEIFAHAVGVGASTTRIVGRGLCSRRASHLGSSEAKPRVLNECPVDIQTPR